MELADKLNYLTNSIKQTTDELKRFTKEYNKLADSLQPTTKELYDDLLNYIDYSVHPNIPYTFILGGDGRSQPWDEVRKGKVVNVKIKDEVYLSPTQIKIVKDYINHIHKPKHINFR